MVGAEFGIVDECCGFVVIGRVERCAEADG
jgi:hypothetical protein